jgi:hypothetical protein
MKQDLMAFLKDRKIFTNYGRGKLSLKEVLSRREQKSLHREDQKHPRKHKK